MAMNFSHRVKVRNTCYNCPKHGYPRHVPTISTSAFGRDEEPEDFWNYCSSIFGNSSINGVSQIATTKQIFRKILWVIVFSGCMAGFLYQTISFLIHYANYPTTVEVLVLNEGFLEFPSVTICNSNRVRKSAYCNYLRERPNLNKTCPDDVMYFGYSDVLNDDEIMKLQIQLLKENKLNIRKKLGHLKSSMILYCDFRGYPKLSGQDCVDRFSHFYDPDFGNCFSFDSSQDDNGEFLQATESDVWQDLSELILILNSEEDEYLESSRDPGFLITFHSARIYPDPFSDGFQLRPGFTYSFALQKFTNELLTLPYKTNCTDYEKLPWTRKQEDRKLSTRMCTAECSQHQQLKECDYVTDNIRLFFDDWSDKVQDPEKEECAEQVSNITIDYCRSLCRVPCKQTSFKVTSDSSAWPRKDKNLPKELGKWTLANITKNLVRVRIYFSTMEHTIYKNYPKYRPLELFSYLGGYVGIWLGISLVAFYEFLERLTLILLFPLNKKKRKLKSSKVRNLMASHIHR